MRLFLSFSLSLFLSFLFFKNLLALLSNLVFPTLYISIVLFSYGAKPATALIVLVIFSILAFIPLLLWLGLLLVILVVANPLFKPMLSPSMDTFTLLAFCFPIINKILQLSFPM